MLNKCELMFCFVGEQPASNFIPLKVLEPKQVIFFHTDLTERTSHLLNEAFQNRGAVKPIEPYDVIKNIESITTLVEANLNVGKNKMAFNLTGGTKLMVLPGFHVCQKYNIPFCYLQSEGGINFLYTYSWEQGQPTLQTREPLSDVITLEEYIKIHIGNKYTTRENMDKYERLVLNCLKDKVDEIMNNVCLGKSLEVDLIFRVGNQVGIAEIKTKNKALKKEGIDHLSNVGGREYFGTYTKKFYIIDREYPENNMELAETRGVVVIELINSENTKDLLDLDDRDKKYLIDTVLKQMQK